VLFRQYPVVVRGGGDLASGVIYRLYRAGFPVVVTELAAPKFVRRAVSYGEAIYSKTATVEGITAQLVEHNDIYPDAIIPVVCDETKTTINALNPVIVVDARMEKNRRDTIIDDAPLVIALGPGYIAGKDCHAVIETKRGHTLGRVIIEGTAEADTGVPGAVAGEVHNRLLRAPADGYVQSQLNIGDDVYAGQIVGTVDDVEIVASIAGVLRGLISSQVTVTKGMKIGDIDPRGQRDHCFTISDKSLAVGGGVLEAVFSAKRVVRFLHTGDYETTAGV
jgi:xanthine dehydrogenase accessory factor